MELLVVVAIMAVMVGAIIGSSVFQTPDQRLDAESWELVGEIRQARMEAVMANCDATLTFLAGARSCSRWLDMDRDNRLDNGELETFMLDGSYVNAMTTTEAIVSFRSDGSFDANAGVCTITLTNSKGTTRTITILPSGEVDPQWN